MGYKKVNFDKNKSEKSNKKKSKKLDPYKKSKNKKEWS